MSKTLKTTCFTMYFVMHAQHTCIRAQHTCMLNIHAYIHAQHTCIHTYIPTQLMRVLGHLEVPPLTNLKKLNYRSNTERFW